MRSRTRGPGILLTLWILAACTPNGSPPIATPTLAPTNPTCTTGLKVRPGEVEGAAGHRYLPLTFTNTGSTACSVRDYPAVELVDGDGAVVARARKAMGRRPVVVLLPGRSAEALVEASAVPTGDEPADCGGFTVRVTPPGAKRAIILDEVQLPQCDLQVHPVTKGT